MTLVALVVLACRLSTDGPIRSRSLNDIRRELLNSVQSDLNGRNPCPLFLLPAAYDFWPELTLP